MNRAEFLKDDTGNRRFWVLTVGHMDLARMRGLDSCWLQQLWAQVLLLFKGNPQGFRLTPDERQQLERVNRKRIEPVKGEIEIRDHLDFAAPLSEWKTTLSSDIAALMRDSVDSRIVGKILKRLSEEYPQVNPHTVHGRTVYFLPPWRYSADLLGVNMPQVDTSEGGTPVGG